MMSLDISSLECLVAIAIVSYVLGYLAAQMQFPDGRSGDRYFGLGNRLSRFSGCETKLMA